MAAGPAQQQASAARPCAQPGPSSSLHPRAAAITVGGPPAQTHLDGAQGQQQQRQKGCQAAQPPQRRPEQAPGRPGSGQAAAPCRCRSPPGQHALPAQRSSLLALICCCVRRKQLLGATRDPAWASDGPAAPACDLLWGSSTVRKAGQGLSPCWLPGQGRPQRQSSNADRRTEASRACRYIARCSRQGPHSSAAGLQAPRCGCHSAGPVHDAQRLRSKPAAGYVPPHGPTCVAALQALRRSESGQRKAAHQVATLQSPHGSPAAARLPQAARRQPALAAQAQAEQLLGVLCKANRLCVPRSG